MRNSYDRSMDGEGSRYSRFNCSWLTWRRLVNATSMVLNPFCILRRVSMHLAAGNRSDDPRVPEEIVRPELL